MQEKVNEILDEISQKQIFLKHVALNIEATSADIDYSKSHKIGLDKLYRRISSIIQEIVSIQSMLRIPIITVKLMAEESLESDQMLMVINSLSSLTSDILQNDEIHRNQVKVSVLGKWYDLPGNVVDSIKQLMDETRSYDRFFLNLCINYDGQEEIVSSCKILARKVGSEKINPDSIGKSDIKENTYSSYFIPPDLVIKTGEKVIGDLMLWDIANSRIHFTGRHWHEFTEADFLRAIRDY